MGRLQTGGAWLRPVGDEIDAIAARLPPDGKQSGKTVLSLDANLGENRTYTLLAAVLQTAAALDDD
jgi:hypothetical protein